MIWYELRYMIWIKIYYCYYCYYYCYYCYYCYCYCYYYCYYCYWIKKISDGTPSKGCMYVVFLFLFYYICKYWIDIWYVRGILNILKKFSRYTWGGETTAFFGFIGEYSVLKIKKWFGIELRMFKFSRGE